MDNDYTASNIKVLSDEEILDTQPWVLLDSLANQYKKPRVFIERGLSVCQILGISSDYFIDRYLKGLDIPIIPEFSIVSMDLQKKRCRK